MSDTPGPWKIHRILPGRAPHWTRVPSGGQYEVFWRDDGEGVTSYAYVATAHKEANAKLIAAAPETAKERDGLLAALDNLCGPGAQFELACDEAEHDESSGCVWCEAREAISNATKEEA